MLKKRIIPVLLLKKGRMVKGKNFKNFVDTGDPSSAVKVYSSQDADELMFLDIEGSISTNKLFLDIIKNSAKECNVPFSVGGGVKTMEDVKNLFTSGADKVVINSSIFHNSSILKSTAKLYGPQSLVASVDYKYNLSKELNEVWVNCGNKNTGIILEDYIKKIEKFGVGEILLNSIDRDGMMKGYDIENFKNISSKTKIPIIACGGAGNFNHIFELFTSSEVSAAACSSLFHFGDYNPIQIRSYLRNRNIDMRHVK